MKFVEIYKLQNSGDQKVIVTCKLRDPVVICDGDPIFIKNLEKDGIRDYSNKDLGASKLFPKDGVKFLENLKFAFKSGYLVATDIQESDLNI
ncbi:MAG: hypothetical protein A3J46_06745 [Candidatus Yanofskybacteria bacterium RIFCSPHIGHO2_02_FULL_41_11]|uniref:Uncharacterized protein n=1 Tax=Candidatus Yanofskybacteria bacterium RIFCSPHIGHO2_02_FULL_41_11 TaxID=1802675 RepID=A0A1F8F808_9BACT|nr:MAG: hypothetical protein A3J46_06745 [Candidatus Yanofskybacteria bacterium RIFCSPHIGHO2_02_FULL_41_11]